MSGHQRRRTAAAVEAAMAAQASERAAAIRAARAEVAAQQTTAASVVTVTTPRYSFTLFQRLFRRNRVAADASSFFKLFKLDRMDPKHYGFDATYQSLRRLISGERLGILEIGLILHEEPLTVFLMGEARTLRGKANDLQLWLNACLRVSQGASDEEPYRQNPFLAEQLWTEQAQRQEFTFHCDAWWDTDTDTLVAPSRELAEQLLAAILATEA